MAIMYQFEYLQKTFVIINCQERDTYLERERKKYSINKNCNHDIAANIGNRGT